MRALALFTGGLDSLLAVRLMQAQGIEVTGLFVGSPLCGDNRAHAKSAAAGLRIELHTVEIDREYCQLLRAPRLGRLQEVAPCLDCRVAMLAATREQMAATGAEFIVSGEVVGQRPRTAVRDLEIVAHHSGLGDLLLRPLSARLLPPTRPESAGWVERSNLLDLQGKSRKRQHELARVFGLPVSSPRPECPLLAEPVGTRLRDLLGRSHEIDAWQLALLPLGRNVPLDEDSWIVIGRNQSENEQLLAHSKLHDAGQCAVAVPVGFAGPTALLVGTSTPARRHAVARLIVELGRAGEEEVSVAIRDAAGEEVLRVASATTPSVASSPL
jgi:tRNA-specific 2-thiouridylase